MDGVALLTWILVSYIAISVELHRRVAQPPWHTALVVLCLLVYAIAMWRTVRIAHHHLHRLPFFVVSQYLAILGLLFLVPNNTIVVLGIITASQLPWVLSFRYALLAIAAFVVTHLLIRLGWWQEKQVLLEAMMYGAFQLFGYFAMHAVKSERDAKDDLAKVNAELNATQQLLSQAARQAERLNISRNLHDVLGHHLTALSIQLEIAAHLSSGDAKTQVQKAQQLAKLLLADVRSAVSDLRASATIDLPQALLALMQAAPRLNVSHHWPEQWQVDDIAVAETLLRVVQEALTNSLRHSNADRCELFIDQTADAIQLRIRDNGGQPTSIREGNGLRGMRERVEKLAGSLQLDSDQYGFTLQVKIPTMAKI